MVAIMTTRAPRRTVLLSRSSSHERSSVTVIGPLPIRLSRYRPTSSRSWLICCPSDLRLTDISTSFMSSDPARSIMDKIPSCAAVRRFLTVTILCDLELSALNLVAAVLLRAAASTSSLLPFSVPSTWRAAEAMTWRSSKCSF